MQYIIMAANKKRLHFGDIVEMIAEKHPELLKGQIRTVMDEVFKIVPEQIYSGNDVSIRKFGVFGTRHAKARKARNPQGPKDASNVINVPEKDVFKFWPNARIRSNLAYEVFLSSGEPDGSDDE